MEITIVFNSYNKTYSFFDDKNGVAEAEHNFETFDQAKHIAEEKYSRWLIPLDITDSDRQLFQRRFKLIPEIN